MPYLNEEEITTLLEYEDDDEALLLEYEDDDDEALLLEYEDDDDEALLLEYEDDDDEAIAEIDAERFFRPRRRRRRGRRVRWKPARRVQRTGYGTHIRGARSARVRTPAGTARIQFGKNLVTKQESKAALAKVSRDMKKTSREVVRVDKALRRVDKQHRDAAARQDRKLARYEKSVDKKLKALGQQALLPLLLQSKPELESITLDGTPHTVTSSTFKSDDLSSMLPLLLMSGGSGLFGGDTSSNPMMMIFMLQALQK